MDIAKMDGFKSAKFTNVSVTSADAYEIKLWNICGLTNLVFSAG